MDLGSYLFVVTDGISDKDRELFVRYQCEELLECQVLQQSHSFPLKGSSHMADLTARHILADHFPVFASAALLVVYKDRHHAQTLMRGVVEYHWDDDRLIARPTGAVRDVANDRENPTFL